MDHTILSTESVSDGIMVSFEGGVNCYYSAKFLMAHAGEGSNLIFLDSDPSASLDLLIPPVPQIASQLAVLPDLSHH